MREHLKLLPTIAFALMLGAGMVMTGVAAWLIVILAYGSWGVDPTVSIARIDKLGWMGIIALGLIGLVIVALAFGKIHSLSITTPMGAGGTVQFDDDEAPQPPA